MERTWLETIQLLGLDLELAVILLMLAGARLAKMARTVLRGFGQRARHRTRSAPTRPLDAWPSQGWRSSH